MDLTYGAYYSVGNACFGFADDLHAAFTTETGKLNNCDGMAGVDEEGKAWATDYDTRVSELLTLVADLGEAVQRLGRVAVHCGYELYMGNYNSIINPVSPPTAIPAMPTVERRFYGAPCKAGADLQGGLRDAADDVIGLANKVGIAIPDGDTDQLQAAAEAWNRLQHDYTAQLSSVLTKAATLMDTCDADDARAIAEKLRGLEGVVTDVLQTCGELSAMCTEFKDALWTLRKEMLWSILQELGLKVAERFILTAATSFLTFGASAVIGAAAIADTVIDYARKIADKVADWRKLRAQAKANRKQRDLGDSKRKTDEAKNLDDESPTGTGGDNSKPKSQNPDFDGQREAQDLRDRLAENGETVGKKKNVAVARGEIDGEEINLDAVSGQSSPSGTVEAPANPTLRPVSEDGTTDRPYDSEFKILDNLAQQLSPDAKGTINLYTERAPCDACQSVIDQFKQRYPGVEVNVTYGP
ncbi:deaminase domain-containing protein [Nocardia ignorata]|uniref:deaminase domain-containing protein n=1 Tax=Nocardia ignorata TaxID=145285 RepID=UPI00363C819A